MPAMTSVLAVASLVGGGISAIGQYQQGQETKKAQEFNATVNEQEAELIKSSASRENEILKQNAILNEYRMRKSADTLMGQQIGAYAKSGVSASTGSPLDVIADSLATSELEISIDKWNAENNISTNTYNAEIESSNKLSEARMRRIYGQNAVNNSIYSGVGTLLTSGTTAYDRLKKEKIGS